MVRKVWTWIAGIAAAIAAVCLALLTWRTRRVSKSLAAETKRLAKKELERERNDAQKANREAQQSASEQWEETLERMADEVGSEVESGDLADAFDRLRAGDSETQATQTDSDPG